MVKLDECRLFDLRCINDACGNLTFVEEQRQIPFDIRRIYHLYDVPVGAKRGGHAH